MEIRFDKKSGWKYQGELYVLDDDFRKVHLKTIKDICSNKYYRMIYHNFKTEEGFIKSDIIYVAKKLKLIKHKNGDISVIGNRLFSEIGMTFIV